MPIRIYTNAPARQLMDDRPFGIVAWKDGSHQGEVHAIVYGADGRPMLRGNPVSLSPMELEGSIEHAMRLHLGTLWESLPASKGPSVEELLEEIPLEEFVLTQIDKPAIRGVLAQIGLEARCDELANAFARFHQTS